jgi:hypothetical protein
VYHNRSSLRNLPRDLVRETRHGLLHTSHVVLTLTSPLPILVRKCTYDCYIEAAAPLTLAYRRAYLGKDL